MAARQQAPAEVARDVSPAAPLSSPAMTTTTATEPRCDRSIDHLPHDTTEGACPGYIDPNRLTSIEVHDRVEELRRATAYGYAAGFDDARDGRPYSNAWEDQS